MQGQKNKYSIKNNQVYQAKCVGDRKPGYRIHKYPIKNNQPSNKKKLEKGSGTYIGSFIIWSRCLHDNSYSFHRFNMLFLLATVCQSITR